LAGHFADLGGGNILALEQDANVARKSLSRFSRLKGLRLYSVDRFIWAQAQVRAVYWAERGC